MPTLYKYTTGGRDVLFTDKEDAYKPADIQAHWASTFPELSNATADTKAGKQKVINEEGQEIEVDKVITFTKKVGTKGQAIVSQYHVRGKLGADGILFAICNLIVEAWSPGDAAAAARELLDTDPTFKLGWVEGPVVGQVVSDGPVVIGEEL
jgi:hypothetical protein